ncbi:hypothetical protein GTY54_25080 [Streptomyces sp. SID625]|nr:hypothetical protein [Streptomyces sp. SID625]
MTRRSQAERVGGTAAVLAQHQTGDETTVCIETNAGIVPVTTRRLGEDPYTAWMRQPLPTVSPVPGRTGRSASGRTRAPEESAAHHPPRRRHPHLYVMADSPAAVAAIVPDFPALGRAARESRARINVFALTGPDTAVTRMFSPYDRLPEDSACGSAAGPLAAYLVRHQVLDSGIQLTLSQGEAVNRPSTRYARATAEQDEIHTIDVGGGVCLIGAGHLRLPVRAPVDTPERAAPSPGERVGC